MVEATGTTTTAPNKETCLGTMLAAAARLAKDRSGLNELKAFIQPPQAAESICIHL